MDGYSLDLTRQGIDIIKKYFPDVISEGGIDFQRLRLALGDDLAVTDHYELTWAGKAEARREIQKRTTCTLHPDFDESVDFENSQNIYIEGENLEVLRILQNSYFGKVKVIYIDPPYNTKTDRFVYPDDFTERKSEYESRTGQIDQEGYLNKLDLFKTNNGQLHSPWLSMMYPRLYLARNLLMEDGAIFVSIDDNEQHNMKLILDEIYGEENFVTCIVWQKKFSPSNDAKFFSSEHDYILMYSKDISSLNLNLLQRTDKQNLRYSNPDNDSRGPWSSADLLRMEHRSNGVYSIVSPFTGKGWIPQKGTSWRHPEAELLKMIENNEVFFGSDGNAKPRRKKFLKDVKQGIVPQTIWKFDEVGHTQEAKQIINKLFDGIALFETPKPVRLIQKIINLITDNNSENIVCDFFSGASSTVQAVLETNVTDQGNRKYIVVQFPEPTEEKDEAYRAGYPNVAALGRERIRRVAKEMQSTAANSKEEAFELDAQIQALRLEQDENLVVTPELFNKVEQSKATLKIQKKIDKLTQQADDLRDKARRYEQVDKGFKAFKLGISNFKPWQKEGPFTDKDVQAMTLDFRDPVRSTAKSYPMLVEFMLKNGLPLTASIQEVDAAGVPVYTINKNELWILLDRYEDGVREVILQEQPKRVVCLDRLFAGNDQLLTNLHLELRERNIELTVI